MWEWSLCPPQADFHSRECQPCRGPAFKKVLPSCLLSDVHVSHSAITSLEAAVHNWRTRVFVRSRHLPARIGFILGLIGFWEQVMKSKLLLLFVCVHACLQVAPRGGASLSGSCRPRREGAEPFIFPPSLSLEAELRAPAVPLCHFQNPEIKRDEEPEREPGGTQE